MKRLVLSWSLFLQATLVGAQASNSTTPSVIWGTCPSSTPPGVDCGSVRVPLTYKSGNSTAAANNQTVTLGLTRLKSTGNNTQGALFFNPGGPGVPATELVAAGRYVPNLGFTPDVNRIFDIIGLDPRGVGASTPIRCDPNIFNERVLTFVNGTKGYDELVDHNRRFGKSCANLTGPLLNHLDSTHVAKDHELVRKALGSGKFNYFGMSYGSLFGSQFIELFPNSVGRIALDGLIDHSQSEVTTLLTEASSYEVVLNRFFDFCDTNTTCPLHGRNSKKIFGDLLARADQRAIPALACNGTCQPNVTGEDIRYNVQNFLEFVDLSVAPNWLELGGAIAEAAEGNATALSTPLATSRTAASIQGSPFSYLAIGCQDWLHRARNATDIELRLQAIRPFAPQTAGASQTFYYESNCIGWPAPLTNGQRALNTTLTSRAPKVLLSNSIYDPATSIVWANGLRQQLPSAVSITRNGTGHTSHFILGETRNVIDNFLATGDLPNDGSIYQT